MHSSRKPFLLTSALISLALLTACASDTAVTVSVAKICPAVPQIDVTKDDKLTERTAAKIEKVNIGREELGCKYEPPAKAKPAPKVS